MEPQGQAEPAAPSTSSPEPEVEWKDSDILELLRQVVDPELHMNIVDLGLVYGVNQVDRTIQVEMTLTSPGCPYGPYILHGVKHSLLPMQGIDDVDIDIVWDPPWGPDKMTEEARLELGFDL
jgi:metal-sulfur cluster biosynthetic enzyme